MDDLARVEEMIEYFNQYLDARSVKPVREWSDGDKIRLLAARFYQQTYFMLSLGLETSTRLEEDLLRIASRLDLLDETESG